MKSYEEMTDSVFQRMGEYAEKQKRRRTAIRRAALPVCCCAVLVCCFGAGKLLHRGNIDVLADVAGPTGLTDTVLAGQTEMQWTEPTPPIPRPDPIPDRGEPPTPDVGIRYDPPEVETEWESNGHYEPYPIPTPAPTLSPEDGEVSFGPMVGTDTPTEPYEPPIPMISDYDGVEAERNFINPVNGEVRLSKSLQMALEEYGSEARYRVAVTVYRDKADLRPEDQEAQEALAALAAAGIIPVVETMYQDEVVTNVVLSLHISAEALEAFPADENLGYYLQLYGEAMPDTDENTVIEAYSFGMMR